MGPILSITTTAVLVLGLAVVSTPAHAVQDGGSPTTPQSAREVPLLDSDVPTPSLPTRPAGTETITLADQGERDHEPERADRTEILSERAATRRVFQYPDGTREVEIYATPRLYQTESGAWELIDLGVTRAENGEYRTGANSWAASFDDVGVDEKPAISVDSTGGSFRIGPAVDSPVAPVPSESDSEIDYPRAWSDADLSVDITPTAISSIVTVESSEASSTYRFDVSDAQPQKSDGGKVVLTGQDGTAALVDAPVVTTADGHDVTAASEASVAPTDGQNGYEVSVDREWLSEQGDEVFPLKLEARLAVSQIGVNPAAQVVNYSSSGATYSNGDTIRLGRSASGEIWRAQVAFDYASYLRQNSGQVYRVTGAHLAMYRDSSDPNTQRNGQATPWVATSSSFAGSAGQRVDNGLNATPTENETSLAVLWWSDLGSESWVSRLVDSWFDAGTAGKRLGFTGREDVANTLHTYWPTLSLTLAAPPPVTALSAPADGSTLSSRTPLFTARPVDGDSAVRYRFVVSTQRGNGGASQVSSGWIADTSWTPPANALMDGAHYFARVETAYDITNPDTPEAKRYTRPLPTDPALDKGFTVDLNLGNGGPAPMQEVGAAEGVTESPSEGAPLATFSEATMKVNMVDGNLALSVPTHSVKAQVGDIGPTLVYNSLGDPSAGLTAEYFADPQLTGSFSGSGVSLRAQRVDSTVDFNWLGGVSPVEGLTSGGFLVRWTGYIAVPASGWWNFGASLTDWSIGGRGGVRVFVNDETTPAVDMWTNTTGTQWDVAKIGGSRNLVGGFKIPVRIELRGTVGDVAVRLLARDDRSVNVAQSTWLSQARRALPDGWTLSAGAGAVSWTGITDLGEQVLLRRADGSVSTFTKTSTGGYSPPAGTSDDLQVDGTGRFVLRTSNGLAYTFKPDGTIDSVSSIRDVRQPAAPVFQYTGGSSPAISSITDPASGRSVTFVYTANGRLSQLQFSDGARTELTYLISGALVRVATFARGNSSSTPDAESDFRYDSQGRLVGLRDRQANVLVAYGARDAADVSLTSVVEYDTSSRVFAVTKPAPKVGGTRAKFTYRYFPAERRTAIESAGLQSATGYSRQVWYDDRGRIISEKDPSGTLTSTYTWDGRDLLVASVDPAGLRTLYDYDGWGRKTGTWGPAPSSDFDDTGRPRPSAGVPHATLQYDDGMSGLAAAYWGNPWLSGPANAYSTGTGTTAFDKQWTTAPTAAGSDGRWSAAFTGSITFPSAASYRVSGSASVGDIRVWVDDVLVYGRWDGVAFTGPRVAATGNPQRIRVAFRSPTSGPQARVAVTWQGGSVSSATAVPTSALRPEYGLMTRSVDADGVTQSLSYTDPSRGIGPEHRTVTARISDPDGLALVTRETFEDPRSGGYLRPLVRTLPAGNSWTSSYYSSGEAPLAAVCGVTTSTSQGGELKQRVGPDPTGPDTARVEQFVYDLSGRIVGQRTGSAASISNVAWSCKSYDGVGRIAEETYPARDGAPAKDLKYSYDVAGGLARATVWDAAGTYDAIRGMVQTSIDLTGRVVAYTSAGKTTTTSYDQMGRKILEEGPVGRVEISYSSTSGKLDRITLDGVEISTNQYDTQTGRLAGVWSFQPTSLGYDRYGRQNSVYVSGNGDVPGLDNRVQFSAAGRMIDESFDVGLMEAYDPSPGAPGMAYDAAGRLVSWTGPNGVAEKTSYADSAVCGPLARSGRNSDRALVTRGSVSQSFCYDEADRLVVGGFVTSVSYDDRGNTTNLNGQVFRFDSASRVISTTKGTTTVSYVRDPVGRIVERSQGGRTVRTGYTGLSGSAGFTLDTLGNVLERYVTIPGGTLLTISSTGETRRSYADLHGNIAAVTDQRGDRVGAPRTFTPWGEGVPLAPSGSARDQKAGYGGANGALSDAVSGMMTTVDLGARTYIPEVGRFLSPDPVVGGCANDYAYVKGDPLNQKDSSGRSCRGLIDAADKLLGLASAFIAPLRIFGAIMGFVELAVDGIQCFAGRSASCADAGQDLYMMGVDKLLGFSSGVGLNAVVKWIDSTKGPSSASYGPDPFKKICG